MKLHKGDIVKIANVGDGMYIDSMEYTLGKTGVVTRIVDARKVIVCFDDGGKFWYYLKSIVCKVGEIGEVKTIED